jgi:vacuolar protein-sorting-associated protein 4
MSNPQFLDKACDIVRQAIEDDQRGSFEDAFKGYKNALDYFALASKCEL